MPLTRFLKEDFMYSPPNSYQQVSAVASMPSFFPQWQTGQWNKCHHCLCPPDICRSCASESAKNYLWFPFTYVTTNFQDFVRKYIILVQNCQEGFDSRIKTGSGEVCCPSARGRVRNRKSNPEGGSQRDFTYCMHKPECIGTINPSRSVLITIITWHFQFHPGMIVIAT